MPIWFRPDNGKIPACSARSPLPSPPAARALGRVGVKLTVPLLKKALQDSEPAVRIAAAGSLLHVLPTVGPGGPCAAVRD